MSEEEIYQGNGSLAVGCETGVHLLHNPALNKGTQPRIASGRDPEPKLYGLQHDCQKPLPTL